MLERNRSGVTIPAKALTAEARAELERLNVTIETIPGTEEVRIVAKTQEALTALQAFAATKLPDMSAQVNVKWNFENPDPAAVAALNANIGNIEQRWNRADGGVVEAGPAAIANRPINQWAEAGPEAYIPLSPNKRGGAVPIWLEAGRRLGMVNQHAEGGIVAAMGSLVTSKFPGMKLTSGLRYTDNGYHSIGQAADFSNGGTAGTPEMKSLADYIATNFPYSLELIHSPFNRNIKNGKNVGDGLSTYGANTMAGHRDHVHWAMASAPNASAASPSVTSPSASIPELSTSSPTTSTTVTSPQASLPGRRSETELQLLAGQSAVDSANSERNRVYANPNSTDQDKLAADIKYQQAQNSLESAQKSSSSNTSDTSSFSLQGIFSRAGSIIADGLLSGLGLENSILSSNNVYNRSLNTVIDFYGNKTGTTSTPGDYSYQPKNLPGYTSPSSPYTSSQPSASDPSNPSLPNSNLGELGTLTLNAPTPTYNAGGGAQQWRDLATKALIKEGFNANQVDIMLAQIQSESGGNPSIIQQVQDVNSGGNEAVGLLQVIPGTFATYRDPALPNDRTHPYANMVAALRYYRSRYGTDLSTMWGQGHGYADGGWVFGPGGPRDDRVNARLSPREFVVNAAAAAKHGPLLESINATAWSSSRVDPGGFSAAPATAPVQTGGGFAPTINARVANVDDLAELVERQAHKQAIGLMAAL
jgi:hypothetical protein